MNTKIKWNSVFKASFPSSGAPAHVLAEAITQLSAPLSAAELSAITESQTNPFPADDPMFKMYRPFDPSIWWIPDRILPASYISFLRWSNGGSFFNDERHFDPFLSCGDLRRYLIGYHVPQYMPCALPFALDGSGRVYLFDMRHDAKHGEYPILFASLGDLRFEHSVEVGKSFLDVCSGTTDPHDDM